MDYTLAGAYDSNIALLLTVETLVSQPTSTWRGAAQRDCGVTRYQPGFPTITVWCIGFLGRTVNARPTTQFIVPYLTAVGELALEADRVDVDVAWQQLCSARLEEAGNNERDLRSVLAAGAAAADPSHQAIDGLTTPPLRVVEF